jgi:SAM-dependent methyltransferase
MAPVDLLSLMERGAREHYDDAAYYDKRYRRRRDDVDFYCVTARRLGGPVLELGAGSGRVTLALAREGHTVVGIDTSAPMLARAREAAVDLPRGRLTLREGDMRNFSLRRRFNLVIAPFNVLMHLYEPDEFAACFDCVRRHLAPGGRFVFDVRVPGLRELCLDPTREYVGRPMTHPSLGRVRYTEQFVYDAVKQVQVVTMRYYAENARARTRARPLREVVLSHRQVFPAELRALLKLGGLRLARRAGDFTGRPLGPDDIVQVVEAVADA